MNESIDLAGLTLPSTLEPAKGDYSRYRVVPARYPAATLGTILAGLLIAAVLGSVLSNPRWGWAVFATWFFSAPVLR